MQDVYAILEFDKIRSKLSEFALTSLGKSYCLNLKILPKAELEDALSFLDNLRNDIDIHGKLNLFGGEIDVRFLEMASKGMVLSLPQIKIAMNLLDCLNELQRFALKCSDASALKQQLDSYPMLEDLYIESHKIIDDNGDIADNASPLLSKIRRDLKKTKLEEQHIISKLVETYAPYLSDGTLTLREGKYVLPVAATYKNKVKGLILDISNSGESFFIEPIELVTFDQKKASLEAEEKKEMHRLMVYLSKLIGDHYQELTKINAFIAHLDFVQAKILYGESMHGSIAELSTDGSLFLGNARHPLLNQDKVVPNTFSFTLKQKVIVVSGPNAGGKTVALKTLGINALFFQCGLMVLASSNAILPYFKHIYLDIGDSQSLEDNLSTFSGHMSNIAAIFNHFGGNDLLLLDEVGTGTSPRQGEALALSVLEYILKKHAYAMISSHFEAVKMYALSHHEIMNASLLFDEDSLTPTYILKMGLPGESYGIEVAKRFGLQQEIIDRAISLMKNESEFSLSKALAKLQALTKENEQLKQQSEKRERALIKKERDLESKLKTYEARRATLKEEMSEEKRRVIEQTIEEVETIIKEMRENGEDHLGASRAKKRLEALLPEEEIITYDEDIAVGDFVYLPEYGVQGKVLSIHNGKAKISTNGGWNVETEVKFCRKGETTSKPTTQVDGHMLDAISEMKGLPLELNIIGMHYDEAKMALDKYLDQCRSKGFKRVRIIHGFGTGTLRKLTVEYLKAHSYFVDKYEAAGEHEGGGGATIVYLK